MMNKIAEVIQASSAGFTAQCYQLSDYPSFGALVKIVTKSGDIIGTIYNIETHSFEPGRRIIARGENLQSEEDIFKQNPQINKLLTTDIYVAALGFNRADSACHYLPPNPAPIHGFVYLCDRNEIQKFSKSLDFLNLLVNAQLSVSSDEVIAACLRYCSTSYSDPDSFLVKAGKELVWMVGGDMKRLSSILKRLKI
jgi:hypothetical protein